MSIPQMRLEDFAEIIMGQSPPGTSYNTEGRGIALLNGPTEFGLQNPIERQWTTEPKKLCRSGDVLFCVRGATAGRTNVADKEYCLGRGLAAIRVRPGKFDSRFLHHVLAAGYKKFQSQGVGSTFINISSVQLANFDVPNLCLEEQRRIAAILDAVDSLRAKRRTALAKLDQLAQSIFIEMFGDPVRNPNGWPLKNCAALCDRITVGIVVKPASYYQANGVPALRSLNIKPNKILADNLVYISELDNNLTLSKTRLRENDVVLVRTGQPGTAAVVPAHLDGANAIDILIATPNKKQIHPLYLATFFNSHGGKRLVLGAKRGQIQQHLNVGALNKTEIPVPPLAQQNEYAAAIECLNRTRDLNEKALGESDVLFSSLQYRAFRGEL